MISKNEICTACMACVSRCLNKCIEMRMDKYGSIYPKINKEHCIDCGICKRICPENTKVKKNTPYKAYLATKNYDTKKFCSASGGVAYMFYLNMLKMGGCCVGTKWNSKLEVEMTVSEEFEELEYYKNSKYVMSNMKNLYSEFEKKIKNNVRILVIGLPCQIAVCVDLVCHGVISPEYFRQYLNYSGIKKASHITFRNTDGYYITFYDKENNIIYKEEYNDNIYFSAYLDGLCFREDCYKCRYACSERVGDITIGDYDGLNIDTIENQLLSKILHPSMILVNTEKGEIFLNNCDGLIKEARDIIDATKHNGQLNYPSIRLKNRDSFLKSYEKYNNFVKAYRTTWRRKQLLKKIYNCKLYKMTSNIKKGLIQNVR